MPSVVDDIRFLLGEDPGQPEMAPSLSLDQVPASTALKVPEPTTGPAQAPAKPAPVVSTKLSPRSRVVYRRIFEATADLREFASSMRGWADELDGYAQAADAEISNDNPSEAARSIVQALLPLGRSTVTAKWWGTMREVVDTIRSDPGARAR